MQSSWSTRPSQLAARPLLGGSTWEKKLKPLVGTTLQQLKHRYAWGPNVCNCSPDELAAAALLIAFGGGGPRSPEPGPQGPSPAIFCKGFADLLTFTRLGRGCTSWGARPENQCRIYRQEKPEQRMQNLQMKMLKPPTGIFFFSIGLTAGAALHWLSMRTTVTSSSGVSLSLFPGGVKAFDTAPLLDACGENLQNKKTMQLTYSALLCVWHLCILHRVAHRSLMKIQKRKKQNTKTLMQNVPCTCWVSHHHALKVGQHHVVKPQVAVASLHACLWARHVSARK